MTNFNIGIDTGGTYTDALIVDTHSHELVASAKSLTTRGKLEIGVSNTLAAINQASEEKLEPHQIGLVSLSTTLATVERVDLPNMDRYRSLIAATVIAECLSSTSI